LEADSRNVLAIDKLSAGYQETTIIENVSLAVRKAESIAILGRNGVGKTTLLRTVMGQTRMKKGRIFLNDNDISGESPWARAHKGIGYVPQEREIFPSLTAEENLEVASIRKNTSTHVWDIEKIYSLFPRLYERRKNYGNQLSGGEQQMLAIGRALMSNPLVLLMDEPFEGLAPVIVDGLIIAIKRLQEEERLAIVLVEQHAQLVLDMTDRAYILDRGRVVHEGRSAELANDMDTLSTLMGISSREVSAQMNVPNI